MILVYHKVAPQVKDNLTVDLPTFIRTVSAYVRNKEIVYLDGYDPDNENHLVITFDDGYKEVVDHALPALRSLKVPFECFIVADWDHHPQFMNAEDLKQIVDGSGRLQYHTKTHPRLDITDPAQLREEIRLPDHLRRVWKAPHFRWFAYPYYRWSPEVVAIVQNQYVGARSGYGYGCEGTKYQAAQKNGIDKKYIFSSS